MISAAAVALTMATLGAYARFIPRSALAALLMLTAARMVNFKEVRYHLRASRYDAAIVLTTAIAALAISIEFCVLIGVIMSCLLTVPRAGHMLLTEFVDAGGDHVRERLPDDHTPEEILVFGLEGEMFFGSSVSLDRHLDAMRGRVTDRTRVLVLRMKRARTPDAVGLLALERLVADLQGRGVHVVLCGVRADLHRRLERCGLLAKVREDHVFLEQPVRLTSTQAAMRFARGLRREA